MKRNLIGLVVFLTGVCIIAYLLHHYNSADPLVAVVIGFVVNIITAPVYTVLVEGFYALRQLPLVCKTQVLYRNKQVRLSMSYLFRIRVNDKYLLVKNSRGNYYQLVGGAYKTLPGSEKIFKKLMIVPDRKINTDHGIAKKDLRFMLPGRNVLAIIRWFHSREDREISQWREFCEELLTTGILKDRNIFRYIDYSYAGTIQTPMQKAKNINCQEILIYEIFDLLPNDEQLPELLALQHMGDSEQVKWADAIIINTLGLDERTKSTPYEIGAHTKWAINLKYVKE